MCIASFFAYQLINGVVQIKRLKMQMTKEQKFGQEVAHILGRANAMKAKTVSKYYNVQILQFSQSVI